MQQESVINLKITKQTFARKTIGLNNYFKSYWAKANQNHNKPWSIEYCE